MDKVFVPFLLLLAWAATTYLGTKMLRYVAPPRPAKRAPIPPAHLVCRTGGAPRPGLALLVALGVVYVSGAIMFVWPVGVLIVVLR